MKVSFLECSFLKDVEADLICVDVVQCLDVRRVTRVLIDGGIR